jgi:uncharacterized protein (UPF0332 family)
MSFSWADYLLLAQELEVQCQAPQSTLIEAKLRAAISRAYYAVFGEACMFLSQKERLTLPREGRHEFVIREFTTSPSRDRMAIGTNLRRLRDHRNTADYQRSTIERLPFVAQTVIQLSQDVITSINQLRNLP